MHTDVCLRKAKNSAENLIDGGDGVTIPPVVARIFSGDSTSPLTRDGHGCPKLNARSFAGCETNRAFIWQEFGAERGYVVLLQ